MYNELPEKLSKKPQQLAVWLIVVLVLSMILVYFF